MWLLLRIVRHVWMMRLGSSDKSRDLGRLVRSEFERLGGFWIKAGHVLAARMDVYPQAFCDELVPIDDAVGLSGEVVKDIIQKETGRPAHEVFREFDVVPVATTSFGQVHAAWLCENGVKVAVKIQRPGICPAFRRDLTILSNIAAFLRFFSMCRWAKLDDLESHLRSVGTTELDYRTLAQAMRRLRRELAPSNVYVPKVFMRVCTERLLVMEFIDGVPIVDYECVVARAPKKAKKWCRDNGIHPAKLRRRIETFAGNLSRSLRGDIMVLRRNRIALLDFGVWGMRNPGIAPSKSHKPQRN